MANVAEGKGAIKMQIACYLYGIEWGCKFVVKMRIAWEWEHNNILCEV